MTKKSNKDVLVLTKENSKYQIRLEYSRLKRAAEILNVVDHPIRKEIISLIEAKKKLSVTDLHAKLRLEQSIASQHLAVLRKAEVIKAKREGKFICYSINEKRLAQIAILIEDLAREI
jgi:DNA-binding transcriptional ArsR family regulator